MILHNNKGVRLSKNQSEFEKRWNSFEKLKFEEAHESFEDLDFYFSRFSSFKVYSSITDLCTGNASQKTTKIELSRRKSFKSGQELHCDYGKQVIPIISKIKME